MRSRRARSDGQRQNDDVRQSLWGAPRVERRCRVSRFAVGFSFNQPKEMRLRPVWAHDCWTGKLGSVLKEGPPDRQRPESGRNALGGARVKSRAPVTAELRQLRHLSDDSRKCLGINNFYTRFSGYSWAPFEKSSRGAIDPFESHVIKPRPSWG